MTNLVSTTVADAVSHLRNIDPAYMTLPIEQGFNWAESFAGVDAGEWYLVVFRSRHSADADEVMLTALDESAQADARQAPGFLYYFIGMPNEQHQCLSFCLWEDSAKAREASRHQAHQTAQQMAVRMYDYYQLERYMVRKHADSALTFQAV